MNRVLLLSAALSVTGCTCYTVEPGNRGVLVDWGKVKEPVLQEGWGWVGPGRNVHEVSIRQQNKGVAAACFSSDLQNVKVQLAILYRIPEEKVIWVFREFKGDPFDSIVAPRAHEAIKEATASRTAEQIVKQREAVKTETLDSLRKKIGDFIAVDDLVIENIDLSQQLEQAIEAKMVQEQEAAKAKFTKQKAEIDAEISITRARGEAESIRIQGDALTKNPTLVQLRLIEKWNGITPTIVTGQGASILLPAIEKK